jgi:O-methyltransferase involved in polyketide biosynthesis
VTDAEITEPDSTAVRVALWRAMHLLVDAPPHVLEDEIGLRLAGPPDGWRERPDMDPVFTAGFRCSVVARARFIEDLVAERVEQGVTQYVLLGAGLDTFAQRQAGAGLAKFLDLARSAGFTDVRHVSGRELDERYFAGRPDGLRMSTGEDFLIATT